MSSGNLPPEAVENSLCNSFDKSLTVKANPSAPTGRGLPVELEGGFQFSWKEASNSVGTVSPYSKRFTVSGYDIKSNEQLCSFGELKLAQSLLRGQSPKQSGKLCRSKTFIPTAANSPLGGGGTGCCESPDGDCLIFSV